MIQELTGLELSILRENIQFSDVSDVVTGKGTRQQFCKARRSSQFASQADLVTSPEPSSDSRSLSARRTSI